LKEKLSQLHPAVFFSNELCARYFTYMNRETGAHFVLFDDADTLRRKVEVAHRAGIHTFIAPFPEVADCLEELGVQKAPAPGAEQMRINQKGASTISQRGINVKNVNKAQNN
jgi:hypothetical protein